MRTALEGRLVLAIEQAVAALLCTLRPADAGARVVKIERDSGDMARHYDRSVGVSVVDSGTGMNAHAAILEALIERQRGVLHHPALPTGEQIQIPRPAGRENFEPGPLPRAGADTERVRREFPKLA
jgi:itaconate CoA-transferase